MPDAFLVGQWEERLLEVKEAICKTIEGSRRPISVAALTTNDAYDTKCGKTDSRSREDDAKIPVDFERAQRQFQKATNRCSGILADIEELHTSKIRTNVERTREVLENCLWELEALSVSHRPSAHRTQSAMENFEIATKTSFDVRIQFAMWTNDIMFVVSTAKDALERLLEAEKALDCSVAALRTAETPVFIGTNEMDKTKTGVESDESNDQTEKGQSVR